MSIIDDGGPVFPCETHDPHQRAGTPGEKHPGLSLRDWLAGQALAGILAHVDTSHGLPRANEAKIAYSYADAMLIARKEMPS